MLVLNTYVPLDKGTKIMVKFSLEQRQLAIPGKVVWNEWELDFWVGNKLDWDSIYRN